MARTWIYQDPKQVAKRGTKLASWYAAWLDPAGKQKCKSFGVGSRGKGKAQTYANKIQADLEFNRYEEPAAKDWESFLKEYRSKVCESLSTRNQNEFEICIRQFEAIVKPKRVSAITSRDIDHYITERRRKKSKRTGEIVSEATVNKELRYFRVLLRCAHKWGWLPRLPEFRFLREPQRIKTYVTPEDFAKLYANADVANGPGDFPFQSGDYWRALLMTAYMTGWRISELLSLRWEDVDLDNATAFLRAENTKGRRDESIKLHPVIVDHLRKIVSFSPVVFPWRHTGRELWRQFHAIQDAAKVKPQRGDHYGFHDLRRAFATMNADRMTADALGTLMRHKSYSTTRRYISMTRQVDAAVAGLFVPTVGDSKTG